MTVIDGVILFILAIGLMRGFMAGAIKTVMSLVGWILALVIASKLSGDLSVLFAPMVDARIWQITLAFMMVALVVLTVTHLVTYVLSKTVKFLKLGLLDRWFGGMFGVAKSGVKILILMGVTAPVLPHLPNANSSPLLQALLPFAPVAKEVAGEVFDEVWQEVENPYQTL